MKLEIVKAVKESKQLGFAPPLRLGPRPQSCRALPHMQLDQWPPPTVADELFEKCLSFPHIRLKESRMAAPECHALSLPDEYAAGPSGAFIVDHEFCHLHPLPDGSIHLTLPREIRDCAFARGWAEPHLASRAGILADTLVMVYAPRDFEELAVVVALIRQSYEFARGCATCPAGLEKEKSA